MPMAASSAPVSQWQTRTAGSAGEGDPRQSAQVILFVALTLLLSIATVSGGRVLQRDSETLTPATTVVKASRTA
jgi:hypothetical protein